MSAKFFSLRSDFFLYKKKLLINIKGTISGNNERVNLKLTVKKKRVNKKRNENLSLPCLWFPYSDMVSTENSI